MANAEKDVQHVFICGAKSVGQYGGYETFVDKLTEYLQDDPRIRLHVTCKANGEGFMDESRLAGIRRLSESEFEYNNAHCVKLPVPNIGPAVAIYYDRAAVLWCIRYCREHHIPHPIVYILTCRIGPFTAGLKRRLLALGGTLELNPDGHEWMREKWSPPVRRYWKLSEQLMVKHSDRIVCDSVNIERYIRSEYARFRPDTTFIAYGAELEPSPLKDDDPLLTGWMGEKGLKKDGYYLVVGRFVPENNYETMLREFMRSDTEKDFALITNMNQKLLEQLEDKLHFRSDPRIKFVGSVYDQALLKKIRENAYAYFHGHEVGGTNPSLLESLGATKLNLLLNVGFNREVGEDAALYWTKESGDLAALIARADGLSADDREQLGERAKARIREYYSWPYIAGRYRELWTGEGEAVR